MNLQKLAGCVILLLFPLATPELHLANRGKRLPIARNETKNPAESNLEKKFTEVPSSKSNLHGLPANLSEVSRKLHLKNSAKPNTKKPSLFYRKSETKKKSAHESANSPHEQLSALRLDCTNTRSATLPSETHKSKKENFTSNNAVRPSGKHKRQLHVGNNAMASSTESSDASTPGEDYEQEPNAVKQDNRTEMGSYLGAPCEITCSEKLLHVFCDPRNRVCECEEMYPVQIGAGRGCEKPKQLGDQCFYAQTCSFFDPNAICTQINHNAICQCKPGFHTVALRKGVKRMFCSEDIAVVSADLPTLLGVATGIAVLTGLLCFVLRLFSGNRYPSSRHYGNANLAPPLLLSSDNQWINGIPLTVQGRPSSGSSCQRNTTSSAQYTRSKGVLVPASRAGAARAAAILLVPCHLQASRHTCSEVVNTTDNGNLDVHQKETDRASHCGSRRPSLTSIHSTTSSQKSLSYSARRFEQENQQREQRAAMKAAREEAARLASLPTPSPMSVDDLLLISTSETNEEDLLCTNISNPPAQSEPPALIIAKSNTEASSSCGSIQALTSSN